MQVYVNVKVMNDTCPGLAPNPVGAGFPANAITQAMTVVLLTHFAGKPAPTESGARSSATV